jgi:hypothetical protein
MRGAGLRQCGPVQGANFMVQTCNREQTPREGNFSDEEIEFQIREIGPPRGQSRVTKLADWGMLGLVQKHGSKPVPERVH